MEDAEISRICPPGATPAGHRTRRALHFWLSLLGLGTLFIALRLPSYNAPLIRDEGEYAYAAQLLTHGLLPYEHSFLQKPPMVAYSYALADLLAPNLFWFPRVLAYLCVAASTLLLGYAVRLEFGGRVALTAMWLFTPMVLLPELNQYTANTEMFMLLPMLGTVALFVFSRHHPTSRRWTWFLAGFLASAAVCYKYTVLPILAALWAVWSLHEWRTKRSPAELAKRWLAGGAGVALAGFAILGVFLASDLGRHLWDCTVSFNRCYANSANFGLDRLADHLRTFWTDWWPLCLLPGAALLKPTARLWVWVALFAAAWVSTAASLYWQYYVPVTPFWAVLCAVGIHHLASLPSKRIGSGDGRLAPVLTAATVVALCLADWPAAIRAELLSRFDPVNPFPESLVVAKRVQELTSPGDRVFVAGSEPQILRYARRFSSTRFVIAYPYAIPTCLAAGYQQEIIGALEAAPPAVVVFARSPCSWLREEGTPSDFFNYLEHMMASSYEPIGAYVLDKRGGAWVEPLHGINLTNMTLVVLRRKNPEQEAVTRVAAIPHE
jgi:hypothetical protein